MSSIILSTSNTTNSKNNELKLRFPMPVTFKDQEVALGQLAIYYSWNNITSTFSNNTGIGYKLNGTSYTYTMPDGYYSIEDISGYLQSKMFTNGHYLLDSNGDPVYFLSIASNSTYYCATLTVTPVPAALPTGYTNPAGLTLSGQAPILQITTAKAGKLLGFSVGSYPSATAATILTSMNSNITPVIHPVTSIQINCNIANNSNYALNQQCIYTMTSMNQSFGTQLMIEPKNLFFFRINNGSYSDITVTLRDQDNNDLANVDNNINAVLLVRDSPR